MFFWWGREGGPFKNAISMTDLYSENWRVGKCLEQGSRELVDIGVRYRHSAAVTEEKRDESL